MNNWIQIFVIALFLTDCIGVNKKNKNNKKKRDKNPNRYITNWQDYGMPREIKVEQLKKILEKTANYERVEYCPFGKTYKRCLKDNLKSVMSKIIDGVLRKPPVKLVKNSPDLRTYITDADATNAENKMEKRRNNDDEESTGNSRNKTISDFFYIVDEEITKIHRLFLRGSNEKNFSCKCREVYAHSNLYSARYKRLKVHPKFYRDPYKRNKPFGKIFE